MAAIDKYFRFAKQVAAKGDLRRQFRLGAVGVRNDGIIVTANNIPHREREPYAHAEARVVRKLDWGATVYIVRILKNGHLAMARPCLDCESTMRMRGVKRCYYSISDTEYGVLVL